MSDSYNSYRAGNIDGTDAPDLWFRFTLATAADIDLKVGYESGPSGAGQKFTLYLLEANSSAVGYQHRLTARGRGPSILASYQYNSNFNSKPPQIISTLGAGTYYLVAEVSDTLVTTSPYPYTCASPHIWLNSVNGFSPNMQIEPGFARIDEPNESVTLVASGAVCAFRWTGPGVPENDSAETITVWPAQTSTYTVQGYDEVGRQVGAA
ncbi:MAG: hypothetical protein H7330_10180, partial [Hymenobacteraceae bacterium]|nr:hypothetical protein [Hymenobacteraceae bacterium]